MQVCARDGCSSKFSPAKGNQKYCGPGCYRAVQAARKRVRPHKVLCVYDGCHTLETTNPATRYCPECQCGPKARKEYQRKREQGGEFLEQLSDELIEYKVQRIARLPDGYKVIVFGDLHIPFHDGPTLQCMEKFWDDFKPDMEVYNGDIFDLYSISPFDKNPTRRFQLQDEIDIVVGWLEKRVKKNPEARRIFGEGNHEDRLRRFLWRHGPDIASLRGLSVEDQLLKTPDGKPLGFEYLQYRSILDLLGLRIEHGYRASRSDTAYPMNVAKLMAQQTQSSGICNHSHGLNTYRWRDSRGSHSYRENGCLCRMTLEYAPFPTTWAWGFVYGVVHKNRLHLTTVPIYEDGCRAEGELYPRLS